MAETPNRAAVTQWLIDLITEQLPAGEKCGDMRAEIDGVADPFPFRVVYPLPGGSVSGPGMGQAAGDAVFSYQVDSVGKTRGQAESGSDRVRDWVCGRTADGVYVVPRDDPEGLRISDRIVNGTPGTLLEGQPPNEVYTVSDTIDIHVTVS